MSSSSSSSSSNSPCAACKFLRRKCTQGCVFAPYFPPDNPGRFAHVHRVFGASNVAKLLNDLTPAQREDAVNSLAYEAEARLHDPVYGCVGYISLLQHRLLQLQRDLSAAKKELSTYIGPAALGPFAPHFQFHAPAGMAMGMVPGGQHQHQQQQQQMVEAQQIAEAVAAREQEMLRSIEQQQEMARLMGDAGGAAANAAAAPSIGGYEASFTGQQQQQGGKFQVERGHYFHHQRRGSDEGRSGVGPSS